MKVQYCWESCHLRSRIAERKREDKEEEHE